jgi:hypothetical protein
VKDLQVREKVGLFTLKKVLEVLVRNDTHHEHIEIDQMHRVGCLQVAQRLVFHLASTNSKTEVQRDEEGRGVTDHQSPVGQ